MKQETLTLGNTRGWGYVIELGPVNLVCARTSRGMVGCGAFNVQALDKFDYPAARVAGKGGAAIVSVRDVLQGSVAETNSSAEALGVVEGMSGEEALTKMGGEPETVTV